LIKLKRKTNNFNDIAVEFGEHSKTFQTSKYWLERNCKTVEEPSFPRRGPPVFPTTVYVC